MKVLIAVPTTEEAPATEYAEAIRGAWSAWNPDDSLTIVPLPHHGLGVAESASGHLPEGHVLIDGAACLAQESLSGSTAPLATPIADALAGGASRISVALCPLTVHDGGRGLLAALTERFGSVGQARTALGETVLELVASSSLPLVGLGGAGAALASVVGAEEAQRRDLEVGEWAAGIEREHVRADLVEGRPLRHSTAPGSGLGGGAGFALLVLGARYVHEAPWVGEQAGIGRLVEEADLAIVVVPSLDAAAMDTSMLTVVGEAALEAAVPVAVISGEDQTSRRARAGLGIVGSSTTEGNTFSPGDVAQVVARVARTWSPRNSQNRAAAT
ncbi:MAG: glycerate kinase [bacterium]|nr:glycerate kinase [bacterium]